NENRGCIYKVPHRLREVNEKAYEPNVVSIGPYHHGKQHLKAMQVIKRSFFRKIAEENNPNVNELARTMRSLEARIRKCYEEAAFYLDSHQLVQMMLLDGCFIVQLIRGIHPAEGIFEVGRVQTDILHDLLLLENQLPFFVL
ncbi:hypothetical protein Gohar_001426, partial [Gossypium harknessii]|nr:hypothetical protein [Gossypium harknessii]